MSSAEVDKFLTSITHSRLSEIRRLRELALSADPGIGEHIKWNAPSFVFEGEDRVTMRLQPRDCVALTLHRGAKVKGGDFAFEDGSGLVDWRAVDRGQIVFADAADLEAKAERLQALVRAWIRA